MSRHSPCVVELLERRALLTGTLIPFPDTLMPTMADGTTRDTARNMLLLSNGSVLFDTGANNANWYVLKPDSQGNYVPLSQNQPAGYVGPTITATAQNSDFGRYGYASDVLPDGNVLVAGGENTQPDNNGIPNPSNHVEIYNPSNGQWTPQDPFVSTTSNPSEVNTMEDAVSEVLSPSGTVIVGDKSAPQAQVFNPSAPAGQQWTYNAGLLKPETSDEETWVKLPGDGGILTCVKQSDGTQVFERFVKGQWITDTPQDTGSPTLTLWSGSEIGPALLLPNGGTQNQPAVLFIGATGHTALYTPPALQSIHGSWTAGPDFTTDGTNSLYVGDTPAALEPNGKVLLVAGYPAPPDVPNAAELLEWDGIVSDPPVPVLGVPTDFYTASTPTGTQTIAQDDYCMLELPNGQTLISNGATGHLFVYQPDGNSPGSSEPTVGDIKYNGVDFTMTGTGLNGMSEGSSFGDDLQNATNYPIVELTGADGIVHFARTHDWNNVGVQTGATQVTTKLSLPADVTDGAYILSVSASGISTNNPSFAPEKNILFIKMGSSGGVASERIVRDGSNVDLYAGTASTPTATYSSATFDRIIVCGVGGNCTFTVDMAGGNPIPQLQSGGIIVEGTATGNAVKFLMGSTTGGDSISFANGSSLEINAGSSPNTNLSPVTMTNVQSLELDAVSGSNSITGNNSPNTIALTLNIAAGAVAALAQTMTADTVTLYVSSLTIALDSSNNPAGTFDLGNNQMLLSYGSATDPMSAIYTDLKSGHNGGLWNGLGIDSSAAASNSPQNSAIGYADSADGSGVNGHANSILLAFTIYGDADLDGTVGANDYAAVVRNFTASPGRWDQGNFFYQSSVDADDYAAVVRNFGETV